jgi:hypothetical protein
MRRHVNAALLCCLLFACLACARQGTNANAVVASKGGACALLSGAEIKSVQGEDVAETQGSERASGALLMSQCYYRLPTFNKSVNLEVVRRAPGNAEADAVKEYWEKKFHGSAGSESEAEREREQERERGEKKREEAKGEQQGGERDREEREASRPQPVSGVGDEAFWSGSQISASLYVFQKGVIIRVSLGGAEDQPTKIKKATALVQQVLKHL